MPDEDNASEKLRNFLCQYFQDRSSLRIEDASGLLKNLRDFAAKNEVECPISKDNDYHRVISELWNMVMERIIEPSWSRGLMPRLEGFRLTKCGKNLLEGLPIDRPKKYIEYLKSQVPNNIDSQIIIYVRESLHSYNLGCYFASSVMLGVAAERLFELLIDAYTNATQNQNAKKQFKQRTVGRGISQQYDEFKKKLPDLVGSNGLTAEDGPSTGRFRHEFKHAIEITFDSIRSYRDYAAHPRDGEFPRHIIMCNLNAFPLFCQRVYQGIGWLKGNGV